MSKTPTTKSHNFVGTPVAEAVEYLIRNEVWDEDYWLCAMKIADQIAKDAKEGFDYDASKIGRRQITALCEVYAFEAKRKP